MKQKRAFHKAKIVAHHQNFEAKQQELEVHHNGQTELPSSNADDITDTFKEVVVPKKRKMDVLYKKNKKQKVKDENYISYAPLDKHTEEG